MQSTYLSSNDGFFFFRLLELSSQADISGLVFLPSPICSLENELPLN